jgi:hypothetical protein
MGTKYIENLGSETIFVGGKMIPPGEGREIDELLLPPEHRDAPAPQVDTPPSLDELLGKELDKSVKDLEATLGGLTQEALDRMGELEAEGKQRKTLLEAIAAEKVKRADAALNGAAAPKPVAEMSLDELKAELVAQEVVFAPEASQEDLAELVTQLRKASAEAQN